MVNKRNLLWLVPLLLLCSFPVWRLPVASFLSPRGGFDPNFTKHTENKHDFVMENVIILQNQAGVRTAEIRAQQAFTSEVANEYTLTSVNADLYDENNDPINIIARTGIYNMDTRLLILEDDVRIDHQVRNQQLYSELLYYYDETRQINSPGNIRLVGENIEIVGASLDYDVKTNQYEIGGRVYTTIAGSIN